MKCVYFDDELTNYIPVSSKGKCVTMPIFKKSMIKKEKDIDYVSTSMISIFLAIVFVSLFLTPSTNVSKSHVGTEIMKIDNEFIIKMDFPGIKETDIMIEQYNRTLIVKAFRLKPPQMKCYSNRYYGLLSKKFILTDNMDTNNIVKHFGDGVLTVTIPIIDV
jgi:HSP20 family molecular chaperone IbpA